MIIKNIHHTTRRDTNVIVIVVRPIQTYMYAK